MNYPWHLYLLIFLFLIAGLMHFGRPKMYLRIMPRYLPRHKLLNYLSGALEILFAAGLLIPETRTFSIYGMILMLLVFLLLHFYMLTSRKAGAGIPQWALALRIPVQFLLIWWVRSYL